MLDFLPAPSCVCVAMEAVTAQEDPCSPVNFALKICWMFLLIHVVSLVMHESSETFRITCITLTDYMLLLLPKLTNTLNPDGYNNYFIITCLFKMILLPVMIIINKYIIYHSPVNILESLLGKSIV